MFNADESKAVLVRVQEDVRDDALRRSGAESLAKFNLRRMQHHHKSCLCITTKHPAAMKSASPSFVCANCVRTLRNNAQSHVPARRTFANKTPTRGTTSPSNQSPRLYSDQPRWKQTPAAMKMPIRLRPMPKQPVWKVNNNEGRLNQAYDLFLGKEGSAMLDEETKVLSCFNTSIHLSAPRF